MRHANLFARILTAVLCGLLLLAPSCSKDPLHEEPPKKGDNNSGGGTSGGNKDEKTVEYRVLLSPDAFGLTKGSTATVEAKLETRTIENGTAGNWTSVQAEPSSENYSWIWSSSNEQVATVEGTAATGTVTGTAEGEAVITATCTIGDTSASGTSSVTVSLNEETKYRMVLSPDPVPVSTGKSAQLTATVQSCVITKAEAASWTDVTDGISQWAWESSDITTATVNGDTNIGDIYGAKAGSVTVTAYCTIAGETVSGTCTANIYDSVTKEYRLSLSPYEMTLNVNYSADVVASVQERTIINGSESYWADCEQTPQTLDWVWESSNKETAIASGKSEKGIVSATGAGTAIITATCTVDGTKASGEMTLTVEDSNESNYRIVLEPKSSEIPVGESIVLTASVQSRIDINGKEGEWTEITSGISDWSWSSSDKETVSVSYDKGSATANGLKRGGSTVTAKCKVGGEEIFTTAVVVVTDVESASYRMVITPGEANIPVGTSTVLTASVQSRIDINGKEGEWTEITSGISDWSWSSSDKEIVSVSGTSTTGAITGIKSGEVIVTAKCKVGDEEISKTAKVTVTASNVPMKEYRIVLTPTDAILEEGNEIGFYTRLESRISIGGIPGDWVSLDEGKIENWKWTSSNEEVATVAPQETPSLAMASAIKKGTATITAKCTVNDQEATGSAKVTVTAKGETLTDYHMTINPSETTLQAGTSSVLNASVQKRTLSGGTSSDWSDIAEGVTSWVWSSSDPETVKVSGTTGRGEITGIKAGTAIITAICKVGEQELSATAKVTVTASNVPQTEYQLVIIPGALTLNVGVVSVLKTSVQKRTVINGVTGSWSNVTEGLGNWEWTSSDSNILKLEDKSDACQITALSEGQTTVTAKCKIDAVQLSSSISVTVTGSDITEYKLTIDPEAATIKVLGKIIPTAIAQKRTIRKGEAGEWTNTTLENLKWYSSNPNVAMVNYKTGEVLALKEGKATVYVNYDVNGETVAKGTMELTVVKNIETVYDIRIYYENQPINVGETLTIDVKAVKINIVNGIYDEDWVEVSDLVTNWKWSSSDDNIARASGDSHGIITGVSEGEVTITVRCTIEGHEINKDIYNILVKSFSRTEYRISGVSNPIVVKEGLSVALNPVLQRRENNNGITTEWTTVPVSDVNWSYNYDEVGYTNPYIDYMNSRYYGTRRLFGLKPGTTKMLISSSSNESASAFFYREEFDVVVEPHEFTFDDGTTTKYLNIDKLQDEKEYRFNFNDVYEFCKSEGEPLWGFVNTDYNGFFTYKNVTSVAIKEESATADVTITNFVGQSVHLIVTRKGEGQRLYDLRQALLEFYKSTETYPNFADSEEIWNRPVTGWPYMGIDEDGYLTFSNPYYMLKAPVGKIPDSFWEFADLFSVIYISGYSLEGSIPNSIWHENLKEFTISNTENGPQIDMTLNDESIRKAKNLEILRIGAVNISGGKLPTNLTSLKKLKKLVLDKNKIKDTFPNTLEFYDFIGKLDYCSFANNLIDLSEAYRYHKSSFDYDSVCKFIRDIPVSGQTNIFRKYNYVKYWPQWLKVRFGLEEYTLDRHEEYSDESYYKKVTPTKTPSYPYAADLEYPANEYVKEGDTWVHR